MYYSFLSRNVFVVLIIVSFVVSLAYVTLFFGFLKPLVFLFDVCNNDSYCDKGYGIGVRTRS